jgi:hypothetical protein
VDGVNFDVSRRGRKEEEKSQKGGVANRALEDLKTPHQDEQMGETVPQPRRTNLLLLLC